jgi:hypothetical protein
MNPLALGGIIQAVGSIAGELITTDKERMELALREREIDQKVDLAQVDVNKAEAAHSSLFVAGWRPAVGWTCVAALAYQFILYPLLVWGWVAMQGAGWIATSLSHPPLLDVEALLVVLGGLLGVASLRTVEKVKGVAR